jgi:hypothetical protein
LPSPPTPRAPSPPPPPAEPEPEPTPQLSPSAARERDVQIPQDAQPMQSLPVQSSEPMRTVNDLRKNYFSQPTPEELQRTANQNAMQLKLEQLMRASEWQTQSRRLIQLIDRAPSALIKTQLLKGEFINVEMEERIRLNEELKQRSLKGEPAIEPCATLEELLARERNNPAKAKSQKQSKNAKQQKPVIDEKQIITGVCRGCETQFQVKLKDILAWDDSNTVFAPRQCCSNSFCEKRLTEVTELLSAEQKAYVAAKN